MTEIKRPSAADWGVLIFIFGLSAVWLWQMESSRRQNAAANTTSPAPQGLPTPDLPTFKAPAALPLPARCENDRKVLDGIRSAMGPNVMPSMVIRSQQEFQGVLQAARSAGCSLPELRVSQEEWEFYSRLR